MNFFRYRLSTLLFVTTVVGVFLAWITSFEKGLPEQYAIVMAVVLALWFHKSSKWPATAKTGVAIVFVLIATGIGVPMSRLIKQEAYGPSLEFCEVFAWQFNLLVGWPGLRIQDGSKISCFELSGFDGYERFLRAEVPKEEYDRILAEKSREVSGNNAIGLGCIVIKEAKRHRGIGTSGPAYWPNADWPEWWQHNDSARFTSWDIQLECSLETPRAIGWFLAYDEVNGIMWVWEWNKQHAKLDR